MKPIIKIENLKREFVMGEEIVHALRGIDLNINEGEFVTIMEPVALENLLCLTSWAV
jgi:putative ABC transport system ATP-binding protein